MAPKDPSISMFPELPADLAALTDDNLAALAEQYAEVGRAVVAKDADTLGERTAEQITTDLDAAAEAIDAIKGEQQARADAEAEFEARLAAFGERAGVTDEADPENPEDPAEPADPEDPAEPEAVEDPAFEPVAVAAAASVPRPVRRPPPPAGRRHQPQAFAEPEGTPLVASSQVYPFAESGTELSSQRLAEISTDMINKNRIQPGMKVVLASATYPFPEERMLDRDSGRNASKIAAVTAPQALVASGGLCAPLTPIYTIPSVETADRPVRDALAGFRADRGGVIVPENPVISDYADAVGIITAEDDELGGTLAVKTCMRIECPQFNSVEVDSIYRCIEVGNLTGRAYPELLARVDTLVLANHARLAESHLLTKIKAGSTAVTDTNTTAVAGATWKLLGYLQASRAGMISRNRMSDNTRLRGLFPEWLIWGIQADLGRAAFERADAEADARSLFNDCGINPTFYKDGPTTGTGQVFAVQTAGALLPFPTETQYALYPEGSWLHLDSGSLDLGIVRDSTLNSTNDYQVFAETWEMVAFIGVESQWHTATLGFNGTFSAGKDFSAALSF